MQLCFCNIMEHVKGSVIIWFSLTCLILPFSDINECQSRNGGCAHQCINTHGSYHCTCRDGFSLRSDKQGCDSKSNIFLPIRTLFLWSNPRICSFRSKTSHHQICWSLEVTDFGSWWLYRAAAEVSLKFQSNWKCLNPHLAASSLHEILQ